MDETELQGEIFCSGSHLGYINSLDVDPVDNQLLLCGGSDSAVTIWDLGSERDAQAYRGEARSPLCKLDMKVAHQYGISKVQWWPFDQSMFFTGSFDGTVKVWDSEGLDEVYAFQFDNKVYNFDVNAIDKGGIIAVGLSSPLIRLVDLRSAGSVQTLKGHRSGSVLSVKWSPTAPGLLASAGSDGNVRIWDVRQASQEIASMDLERVSLKQEPSPADFRKAHRAACNGLSWCGSDDTLISVGLDNKARLWSHILDGGINESANFGPLFQNSRQQTLDPLVSNLLGTKCVFLPSDTGDVLFCTLNDGKLVQRLVPPGKEVRLQRQACIVARRAGTNEFYSSACDGSVVKWTQR